MTPQQRFMRHKVMLEAQGFGVFAEAMYIQRYDAYDVLDLGNFGYDARTGEESEDGEGHLIRLELDGAVLDFWKASITPFAYTSTTDSGRDLRQGTTFHDVLAPPDHRASFRVALREAARKRIEHLDGFTTSQVALDPLGRAVTYEWCWSDIDVFHIDFRCPGSNDHMEFVYEDRWFYDLGQLQRVFWGLIDRYDSPTLVPERWKRKHPRGSFIEPHVPLFGCREQRYKETA